MAESYGSRLDLVRGEPGAEIRESLMEDYRDTLLWPRDDMWAAFADGSSPYGLLLDGETVGFCSVNSDRELHTFFVASRWEDSATTLLEAVIEKLELSAAFASTVEPNFLSLCLEREDTIVTKALLYRHLLEPLGDSLEGLELAESSDLEAAIVFAEAAIGAPRAFLEPYFGTRIDRGELLLHRPDGTIAGTGECRRDIGWPSYSHLGMIVGRDYRGRGLGSLWMHALVLESRSRGLVPLCSTEPSNMAARRAISRAGFRARHRVFRVAFSRGE